MLVWQACQSQKTLHVVDANQRNLALDKSISKALAIDAIYPLDAIAICFAQLEPVSLPAHPLKFLMEDKIGSSSQKPTQLPDSSSKRQGLAKENRSVPISFKWFPQSKSKQAEFEAMLAMAPIHCRKRHNGQRHRQYAAGTLHSQASDDLKLGACSRPFQSGRAGASTT
ncbi:hypothetical protein BM1_09235 [Bipolaris maydis]|nr:hypothetical protein BM1_09235 [Bipolaris maydis]